MELRHLKSFVAVAEQRNFGRAARSVNLSQPALSKQIQQLEEATGVLLFERERPQVLLTAAGRALLPHARALLAQAASALVEARQVQEGLAGELVVGFVAQTSFALLPRLVQRLRKAVPQAALRLKEMSSAEQLRALVERRIDLALVQTKVPQAMQPGLESVVVARERFALVMSRLHPLASAAEVRLKDFLGDTVFLPAADQEAEVREAILASFMQAGGVPTQLETVERAQTAICLAAANLGVALVPESARAMRMEEARFHRLRGLSLPLETQAVWRRDDPAPLVAEVRNSLMRLPAAGMPLGERA